MVACSVNDFMRDSYFECTAEERNKGITLGYCGVLTLYCFQISVNSKAEVVKCKKKNNYGSHTFASKATHSRSQEVLSSLQNNRQLPIH